MRAGWTRIELLVSFLVVVTAAGLVASVILWSRAPAQRVECAMHLQRIGSAVLAFHDERKTLPASYLAPGYATWAVQIAPFLPQSHGKALTEWNLALPYYDQQAAIREGQVWVYYCPARRAAGQISASGDVPLSGGAALANCPGALGDYGCAPTSNNTVYPWTSTQADGALIPAGVQKEGNKIVRYTPLTTLAGLARGQGNTILLGEKHVPVGGFGQGLFGDGSLYNGDYPASFARLIDKVHALAQDPEDRFNLNFGSWHPGICQFLMADGGLRAFATDVSPELLQDLVPRGLPE